MRWFLLNCIALIFGVLFWVALDAAGAPHVPFDIFDNRTLCGLAMWLCAVFAYRAIDASSKEKS